MTYLKHTYRWFIVVLLFCATTINYLDRQIIGLLKPSLETTFHWTETDFAHIVMAFTAAYAIGLLVSGKVIDRIGTKLGYTLTVIIWSLASMLHAIARSAFGGIGLAYCTADFEPIRLAGSFLDYRSARSLKSSRWVNCITIKTPIKINLIK
ncbi:hypothetical protein GCM10023231_11380 [Olivibacter ginsenosidimutans]|uniref:Major facilitator superfamily (MFS) profile domain-containing protein n=1 Tax=Olivibacter ginsenosidimutans TaxID=1176537 RepID=A0ABP9AVM3_9SPHI